MTEEQEHLPPLPATELVERFFTQASKRLGRAAGKTTFRVQQAVKHLREGANQIDVPVHEAQETGQRDASASKTQKHGGETGPQETRPTVERAEELVEQMVHRVSFWTASNGLQVRRSVARLREEAEDLWVEAQQMRHTWKEPHK